MECILGKCKNNCTLNDEQNTATYDWEKVVSYYRFEPVIATYYNRQGGKKTYSRIGRKDYTNVTLKDVYSLLMEDARKHLAHRYHVMSDKVYWGNYLTEVDQHVLWLDYSMNIKLVEKNQVQSAHYSGRQQTLHDTLVRDPVTKDNCYIYHLSDDTNHDSVLTKQIITSVINEHPEIIKGGELILRSDNCSTQYKSRYVFQCLLDIAKQYSIYITWFYGEAGHGRGLIDAMSWFGCKGPLRHDIVVNDSCYGDAHKMLSFLKKHFENDTNKEYYYIDQEDMAKERRKGRKEHCVKGSDSTHVIQVSPDGNTVKFWKTVLEFLTQKGSPCDVNESSTDQLEELQNFEPDDDEIDMIEIPDWNGTLEANELYSHIAENTFVAIRAPPESLEMFHLMKITQKGIADQHMMDTSQEHCVLKGEPYLIGRWYSFVKESHKFAVFKEAKGTTDALIHVGEVFSTDVSLNKDLQIDINDYKFLCCGAF